MNHQIDRNRTQIKNWKQLLLLLYASVMMGCTQQSTPAIDPPQTPIPTITEIPREDCPAGMVESVEIPNEDNKSTYIYTPPCYAENTEDSYPVLYLLHGGGLNQRLWIDLGATTKADRLINTNQIAPLIIVMPHSMGFRDKFDTFLFDELIPYMDDNYRVKNDREHRSLGGISLGAGMTVRIGLQNPDMFSKLGIHSLALVGETPYDEWLPEISSANLPQLYLDIGKNDGYIRTNHKDFLQYLQDNRISHQSIVQNGEHTLPYWKGMTESYLRWYSPIQP